MTPELLPCAHCGGIASCYTKALDERMGYVRVCTVTCKSCGARVHAQDGTDANGWAKDNAAEAKAIAAWNRRAPLSPAVLAELPEVRALVAAETERCAKIADAYADENIRMAGDTVLLDPVLHTPKGHKLTAKDFAKSEELVVSGAVHSAMFHAAQNIAAAIREARNG